MAPIRAKKLRYYEDRNFRGRILPPPDLDQNSSGTAPGRVQSGYADRPQSRPDDWSGQVRVPDSRLGKSADGDRPDENGGLQQQRHPGLAEEVVKKSEPPRQLDLLGLDKDDADPVSDKHAMDRANTTGTLIRAHTINQGRDSDTLPSF